MLLYPVPQVLAVHIRGIGLPPIIPPPSQMLLTVPEWLSMSVQRKCGKISNMAVRTLRLKI